jgi:hypothetical protein
MSRIEILWRWIVATSGGGLLCWLVVCCLTFAGAMIPFRSVDEMVRELSRGLGPVSLVFWALIAIILMFGLIVGAAQRRLLPQHFSIRWIYWNIISWALAFLSPVASLFILIGRPTEAIAVSTLVAGLLLGVGQWWSLPGSVRTIPNLIWWVISSIGGLAMGALFIYWAVWVLIIDNRVIFAVLEPFFPLKATLIALAGLLPYSIITGFGLVQLKGVKVPSAN